MSKVREFLTGDSDEVIELCAGCEARVLPKPTSKQERMSNFLARVIPPPH